MEKTTALIAKHEGLRLNPYKDSVGKLTIGYGRNLDDVGISQHEAESMLTTDVSKAYAEAQGFEWFNALNSPRKAAVVNMIFNLGLTRFLTFENTIMFMEKQMYLAASEEILKGSGPGGKSKWYHQVGKRALEISDILKTGDWPHESG